MLLEQPSGAIFSGKLKSLSFVIYDSSLATGAGMIN